MKIFFTVLSLLIFSVCVFSQPQDTIHWSPCYKLKWEDFQDKPDNNSIYGAISRPGIKYSLSINENTFSTKVVCYFLKSKSWSKFKNNDSLLKHEQLHFDITELFARKLRKAFTEYKFNLQTISPDFKKIFAQIKQEKDNMNILYDKETSLSRNETQQLFWNKKIKSELDKLKEYASH